MAIYAIGDIQGCFDALRRLLDDLRFDPACDRLWSVGDLVNRGPQSLETLRFFRGLGEAATVVLGNHDLHLLAVQAGAQPLKPKDSFAELLAAADAGELLHWLRHRPLLHHDAELGVVLAHAGIAPAWDLATASACAREVEAVLRSDDHPDFFTAMYGNEPAVWQDSLTGTARLRYIVNAFTRMRYCDVAGRLDLDFKGRPGEDTGGLMPWFEVPGRRLADQRIVFGHWSTLGLLQRDNLLALDTGCVWGGRLTAARLDAPGEPIHAVDCPMAQQPGREA
ncbi:MAG: symmetrical bis(5'-nucleosyl)-tetraphosphatase [Gammaproteobacteria bacterium]|nr:symmetrical bis(5'-nucleosyl)-tetraphosphatase [Gammaproteobacteria bacterium]